MSNNKVPPVKIADFDPLKISYTTPTKNEKYSKSQKNGFVRYAHPTAGEINAVVQTPDISLEQYGIPGLGEFVKSDEDREYIKIPLNLNNPKTKMLHDKFTELDLATKNKHAPAMFGSKIDKHQYIPIVRDPFLQEIESDDDEETQVKKNEKNGKKLKYMKVKLDVDYTTKKVKTLIYRRLTKEEQEKTNKKREQVHVDTMTDVADLITFNSVVKIIVMINKMWVAISPNKAKKIEYGVGLKALQIEVEPTAGISSIKNSFGSDAFVDEESDDVQENKLDEEDDAEYEEVEVEVEDAEVSEESEEKVIKTKSKKRNA